MNYIDRINYMNNYGYTFELFVQEEYAMTISEVRSFYGQKEVVALIDEYKQVCNEQNIEPCYNTCLEKSYEVRERKRYMRSYFIKQRIIGIICLILCFISIKLDIGATIIVFFPIGLGCLLSKKPIINDIMVDFMYKNGI